MTTGYRNIPKLDNASSLGGSRDNMVLAQSNLRGPSGNTLDSHYRKHQSPLIPSDVSVTHEPSTTIDDEPNQPL